MRRVLLVCALVTAACATPDAIALTPQSPIENCLVEAGQSNDARRACIGSFSAPCIERDEANQTIGGTVQCLDAERLQWRAARDARVAELRRRESPSQNALLTAALEQHERWTQARCAYAASIYEGGSLARLVAAHCMRDAIAEQTIELVGRYDEL